MYEINFYQNEKGYSETVSWIRELDAKALKDKDSRIRLKKLYEYMELLKNYGTHIGQPMVKHLTGTELWELRPSRDRIIFAAIQDNVFLILNHFEKKTEKTPRREIEKANRMLSDYKERSKKHE